MGGGGEAGDSVVRFFLAAYIYIHTAKVYLPRLRAPVLHRDGYILGDPHAFK